MAARNKTNRKTKSFILRKRRLERKRSQPLNFETLERRELLAAITVSNATDILSSTADTSSIAALVTNDGGDGISLREAIAAANNTTGTDAITFDASVFTSGDDSLIRLTQGELLISDSLSIDGDSVGSVLITGDANGDDITVNDAILTDVAASFGGTAGASDDLLDDNSRVINFTFGSGNLTLTGLTITGGRTTGVLFGGGGIRSDGELSLINSTVSGNSSSGFRADGGGIHTSLSDLTLINSTISLNSVTGSQASGGGVSLNGGDLSLINSTVSGNGSEFDGGGVWFTNATVLIVNSTLTENVASGRGGGVSAVVGVNELTLQNTILAGNTDNGTAPDLMFNGSPFFDRSVRNSLIGDSRGADFLFGNDNIIDQQALLGPLADNGGPTQTHALLLGSPAINAGSNALAVDKNGSPLSIDQLGETRITRGTVDIGAVEFFGSRDLVVTTRQDIFDLDDGVLSLREAIAIANDPLAGVNDDGDADGDGFSADTISFDARVFDSTFFIANRTIRLTQGELVIDDSLSIDGSSVGGVVITGDAGNDDVTVAETGVTDLSASFGGIAGASDDFLDDNSRVLNFSAISGHLTLTDLTITGGRTTEDSEDGGGIRFDSNGTLALGQVTVSGNSAVGNFASGGGIYNRSGDVLIGSSTLSGNSSRVGGGIYSNSGTLILTNSTVSKNNSVADGGGIFASQKSVVSLTNTTVSGNVSGRDGGGIFIEESFVSVNSTVTGNSAAGVGGGISLKGDGLSDAENLTLLNSIVAGNDDDGTAPDLNATGDVVDDLVVRHSLIGDTTGSGISTGTGDGNILDQSALLGPLADNGGLTFTHALLPDSPAIDAGSNALALDENGNLLIADQRGEVRGSRLGTVDIGAFELESESNFEARSVIVTTSEDVVDRFDSKTSLREAIEFANDSNAGESGNGDADGDGFIADTITFDASVFTGADANLIRLIEGELLITNSLTIDGATVGGIVITGDAAGDDVTLLGSYVTDVSASFGGTAGASDDLLDDNSRVLNFSGSGFFGSGNLTLAGLTITGGRAETSFPVVGVGGGLRFRSINMLTLSQSVVSGNFSDGDGGGIYTYGGVSLTNSTVSGNTSGGDGGGIVSGRFGDVFLDGSTVSGNVSVNSAGGIASAGNVLLTGSTISGNASSGSAGGILSNGNVLLTGSTIIGNISGGNGGGISSAGNVSLTDSTLSNNRATGLVGFGGGILVGSGDVSLSNSTVSGNSVAGDYGVGGGIAAFGGELSIIDSTISGNMSMSVDGGGGIGTVGGNVSLINSTLSGNFSGGDGGGILSLNTAIMLVNSTVTGNSASGTGGGISSQMDAELNVGRLTLGNSIVAGNLDGGTAPDVEAASDLASDLIVDNSLIGVTTGSGITAVTGTGNILNQSALLGPLANNGGLTLTHALLSGSPAIGAGSNALALDESGNPLTTDQRGEDRIQFGAIDIGALESEFDDPFLLGDTNLDGEIDFDDIAPLINLLANNSFLNEADIDRDGEVTFDDIGPFITLLADDGSPDQFSSSLTAPVVSSAAVVMSEANAAEPPVSSLVSVVTSSAPQSFASVGSTVEASVTTKTSSGKTVAAKPAVFSPDMALKQSSPQASLVFVSDSLATPVVEQSETSVFDGTVFGATPIDTFVGPVAIASDRYQFLGAGRSSFRGSQGNRPLLKQRSLQGSAERINGSPESLDQYPLANASSAESFSTAADLFDAHPESLDVVFDFEVEKVFAGLIS